MLYIFLGSVGIGKGTLATKLKNEFGFIHISTGNLFREIMKGDDDFSKSIKVLMDSGNFIDDETTFKVVKNTLDKVDLVNSNIILDGYPRNIAQIGYLERYMDDNNISNENITIIILEADKALIIHRLTGRRICSKCGKIYHITDLKPQVDNICDLDQQPLIKRADDSDENIQHRLSVFKEQTQPVLDYFKNDKVYKTIVLNIFN